jgi:hypothetical protein
VVVDDQDAVDIEAAVGNRQIAPGACGRGNYALD